jgi:hypothetical protein
MTIQGPIKDRKGPALGTPKKWVEEIFRDLSSVTKSWSWRLCEVFRDLGYNERREAELNETREETEERWDREWANAYMAKEYRRYKERQSDNARRGSKVKHEDRQREKEQFLAAAAEYCRNRRPGSVSDTQVAKRVKALLDLKDSERTLRRWLSESQKSE